MNEVGMLVGVLMSDFNVHGCVITVGVGEQKRCGTIPDKSERQPSSLGSGLQAALKKSGLEFGVDVSAGFGGVLAIKDMAARDCVTKAADYAGRVLKKFLLPRIEDIIDKDEKVAQSDLADQTEDAIKEPAKLGVQSVRTRRETTNHMGEARAEPVSDWNSLAFSLFFSTHFLC